MKRIIIIMACAVMAIASAQAQISAYKQGNSASIEGYSLPRTVITVTVTQEREVVLRGPFAKYASQYLGISSVAQNDKESYKLIDATLGYYEEPDPSHVYMFDEKSGAPTKIFNWLTNTPPAITPAPHDKDFAGAQPSGIVPFKDMGASPVYGRTTPEMESGENSYRTSAVEKSPEQMASDAAAVVFKIRQRRIELITGEQGEGVFGAGLKAALNEMDKIEAEYVSLFIGKRFTQRIVKTFSVVPTNGKNRITAFRFSDSKGIVADTDVSGRPINIELTPEVVESRVESAAKKGRTVTYRIPLVEFTKLTDGQEVLSTMRIPVFQLGQVTEAPVVFAAQ